MSTTDARAEQTTPLRGLTASYSEAAGVELRGKGRALLSLCELLTSASPARDARLELPRGGSPVPYDTFLTVVSVERRGEGLTRVRVEGDTLSISGAAEGLGLLAENIAWFVGESAAGAPAEASSHLHVEHYPGHPFLSPDAEPLVVALEL